MEQTSKEASADSQIEGSTANRRTKVIVATTVMLSFISFWRAAAIVLNDLGSSAYYVGGIAEKAVGRAAPWFILGVMLFSYAVRAVYVESCAMFTRGGVYRVVKEAMGGVLAKLSVSALMFDYVLTGPISGVSAGQYIVGLMAQTTIYFGHPWTPSVSTVDHLAGTRFFPKDSSPKNSLRKPARTYLFQIVEAFSLFAGALQRFHRRTHESRAPSPAHAGQENGMRLGCRLRMDRFQKSEQY